MKKVLTFAFVAASAFALSACNSSSSGQSDKDDDYNGDLTGQWRIENHHTLYSIKHQDGQVIIDVCNDQTPMPPLQVKDDEIVSVNGEVFLKIIDENTMAFAGFPLEGRRLSKFSENPSFDYGHASLQSQDAIQLSADSGVCAYRQLDNIYNGIAAPYQEGYLLIELSVDPPNVGIYDFALDDVYLSFESDSLDIDYVSSKSGSITIDEYSSDQLKASFQFVGSDGLEYNGEIDVTQ